MPRFAAAIASINTLAAAITRQRFRLLTPPCYSLTPLILRYCRLFFGLLPRRYAAAAAISTPPFLFSMLLCCCYAFISPDFR